MNTAAHIGEAWIAIAIAIATVWAVLGYRANTRRNNRGNDRA